MALTREQQAFLEECEAEFSERYTAADRDFTKIQEAGIPDTPIVCPWYGRTRYNNREGGRGDSNRNDDRRSDNRGYYNRNRGYRGGSYRSNNVY